MKKKAQPYNLFPKTASNSRSLLSEGRIRVVASGSLDMAATNFYTPEMTGDSWLLPKSRIEQCFPANTLVFTGHTVKNIQDIGEGESLLGRDGVLSKSYNPHVREYSGDLIEIKPYLLPSIKSTPEHPILIVKGERCSWKGKFRCKPSCLVQKCGCQRKYKNYTETWVNASEVTTDDFVIFPRYKEYKETKSIDLMKYVDEDSNRWEITEDYIKYNASAHKIKRHIQITEDLFRLFGWYFAEGSGTNGPSFALNIDERHIAEFLDKVFIESFGISGRITEDHNSIVYNVNSRLLSRFFTDIFGNRATNKQVPEFIMQSSNNLLKEFLLGWIGGDGTISEKEHKILLSTSSRVAAHQTILIGSKLGFIPGISIQGRAGDVTTIKGIETKFNTDHHVITMTGDAAEILGIPFNVNKWNKSYYSTDTNFYIPVRSVTKKAFEGKVYNIATTSDTYVTSCVVHNCKWIRIFFNLDPYIHSIITMHAQYPFSTFTLDHPDATVRRIFDHAVFQSDIDWYDFILQCSLSYNKYGECIIWGNWDNFYKRWESLTCLDPDIVEVKQDFFTGKKVFELIPTLEIKEMVREAMLNKDTHLPEVLIQNVQNNSRIPIDSEGIENPMEGEVYEPPKIFMLARRTDPGALRGTSRIVSAFKALIYQDKIRLAQLAIADRHHLPIELWTVGQWTGDPKTSNLPKEQDLKNIREMIRAATQNPPFSIVYSPMLKYEALGVSGKLLSVYEDLGWVENQLLVALGTSKELILGGGAAFSNSKTLALHRIIMEYQTFRDLFTAFFTKYVLLPIAKANNLKDENGFWQVPKIKWDKSLRPEQDKELFDIFYKLWKDGIVSTKTMLTKVPAKIEFETEKKQLEDERDTVFDKGNQRLGDPHKRKKPQTQALHPDAITPENKLPEPETETELNMPENINEITDIKNTEEGI